MKVGGRHYRSIELAEDGWSVLVVDQTRLPFEFGQRRLATLAEAAEAIRDMVVRGAPLIGATAAYGVATRDAHRFQRRQGLNTRSKCSRRRVRPRSTCNGRWRAWPVC